MRLKLALTAKRGRPSSFSERSPRDRRAIGITFVGMGIFVLGLDLNLLYLNHRFEGPTTEVIGSVEALYPSSGRSNPRVAYCYWTGSAEIHTATSVGADTFAGLPVGEPLPIKFLPNDATKNRLDLPAENEARSQRVPGGAPIALFFIFLGASIFKKARQDMMKEAT